MLSSSTGPMQAIREINQREYVALLRTLQRAPAPTSRLFVPLRVAVMKFIVQTDLHKVYPLEIPIVRTLRIRHYRALQSECNRMPRPHSPGPGLLTANCLIE